MILSGAANGTQYNRSGQQWAVEQLAEGLLVLCDSHEALISSGTPYERKFEYRHCSAEGRRGVEDDSC